jgi:hypothetical protein
MQRRKILHLAVTMVVVSLGVGRCSTDESRQSSDIGSLIDQLGSKATQGTAIGELMAIGPSVIPELGNALGRKDDVELKEAAIDVLFRLAKA